MKTSAIIVAALFTFVGLGILGCCVDLSVVLGGLEYGDFNQYAWVGKSEDTWEIVFADWPTGEWPAYASISAWWLGFGCLAVAAPLFWFSNVLRRHDNAAYRVAGAKPSYESLLRGVGVGLIIMGVSSALYWPIFRSTIRATSGWTSFSWLTPISDPMATLQNAYFSVTSMPKLYLPSIAQSVAGALMLLLSRPIGRWLTRGLSERGR